MKTIAMLAMTVLAVACSTVGDEPEPQRTRLVSWNIHHGEGLDGKIDLDRIAAELRALQPDIVCLQEVDVGVTRSQRLDIPAELARRLDMHAAFGKNIDYQGGDYGNAILSRFSIAEQHNHHYHMLRQGEQRGLLVVALTTPTGTLRVGCTHLDYRPDASERLSNADEILAMVAEGRFEVLAGDFNDRPASAVHERLLTGLRDATASAEPTFPAAAPDRRIDWVLVTEATPAHGAHVAPTAASDHRPVAIEFAIPRR